MVRVRFCAFLQGHTYRGAVRRSSTGSTLSSRAGILFCELRIRRERSTRSEADIVEGLPGWGLPGRVLSPKRTARLLSRNILKLIDSEAAYYCFFARKKTWEADGRYDRTGQPPNIPAVVRDFQEESPVACGRGGARDRSKFRKEVSSAIWCAVR